MAIAVPVPPASPPPLAVSTDYASVRERMTQAGFGELARDRNFLAFDPSGDGRAVEVIGDLASARRIVVLVPGVDTTLRDFDRGLGGVPRRAPSVQARAVYEAVGWAPDVAVVAWLGYDPPEGMGVAAVRRERALAGAQELQRFVPALNPNATFVIVGHSYGTVVMGLAAASGLPANVTDLVALASPGLGEEFRPEARLWGATAETDWIRRVPAVRLAGFGHGPDPADSAARPLPTDGVTGHDAYLVPGSTTLQALAGIILNQE